MAAKLKAKALAAIEKRGALLVYPIQNRKEPLSLWSELFPRSKMVWDWGDESHNKIADLWYLREELSRSRKVVYSKWFQNRATLFSFEVFVNLAAYLRDDRELSPDSRNALDALESDSPLSTKQLKAACDLEGRLMEASYNRAMRPLWQRLQIVAFGEFEDSSFPSLGIGATRTLFEELWNESQKISPELARKKLLAKLGEKNPFYKYALKIKTQQR
jgi:hypothetical protein